MGPAYLLRNSVPAPRPPQQRPGDGSSAGAHRSQTAERASRKERPASAKQEVERSSKRVSHRPVSASRPLPGSKSANLSNVRRQRPDSATLARLKPKHISMDKEQLYEETLILKMEVNFFKEQNVRLKTKLQQTEKELGRKEDYLDDLQVAGKDRYFGSSLQNVHLINSLKHTIKELKAELKSRDDENARLKRDTKVSRINELEIELQAYIDECTRLRHHIEEVMIKMQDQASSYEDIGKIEEIMRSLTAQKSTLEGKLASTQTELKQARDLISQLESKAKTQQPGETHQLKAEIRKLQHQLEQHEELAKRTRALEAESRSSKSELSALSAKLQSSESARKKLEDQVASLQLELAESRAKPVADGPIIDDSKYDISVKEEVKVEASYESERAIIDEIEKSARKSTLAFTVKCRSALEAAGTAAKKKVKRTLENPVPESLYEALTEAGVSTTVDEVAVHLQSLAPALLEYLSEVDPEPQENESVAADTFRVKDSDSYEESFESKESSVRKSPEPKKEEKEKLQKAMKVMSFRLQLHRIPKSKLASVLFGKKFSAEAYVSFAELYSILSSPPFNLSDVAECRMVTAYALEDAASLQSPSKGAKMKEVVGKLFRGLDDWEVFTTEDEGDFDQHISRLLTRNSQSFLALCKQRDTSHTGDISLHDLKDICKELNFDFDIREMHYMELLFFSLNFQLNQVPYKKFVQAYAAEDSRGEEESDPQSGSELSADEESRHRLVRDYVQRIANELNAKGLGVKDVFRSQDGFLYPDRLIAGMRALGIPDMRKEELIVFLEALQCEDLDEYGIDVRFFQEIVENYSKARDKSLVELGSSDESRSLGEHSI